MAYDNLTNAQLAVEGRDHMNKAQNAATRALHAIDAGDYAKARVDANTCENFMLTALARQDELIRRGCDCDVDEHDHESDPTPGPAPAPTPSPSPAPSAFADVNYSDFVHPASAVHKDREAWPEGAFRLTGNIAKLGQFDPIMAPGQAVYGHLHQFWGNTEVNPGSTHETLVATGDGSTDGRKLNRSAYWSPTLLLGGQVWLPDNVTNYYKMLHPEWSNTPTTAANIRPLPEGLRFIFGNLMMPSAQDPHVKFQVWDGAFKTLGGEFLTLADARPLLKPGMGLIIRMTAPECWNGDLDSADHRSHMAYSVQDPGTGQRHTPAMHPYVIPQLTYLLQYTVPAGGDPTTATCSSDMPGMPTGSNFHADYMEGWHPKARQAWFDNALARVLNCSGGDLGDGTALVRPLGFTFSQRPNLVPIP